jgi:hypothetical protein
MLLEAMVDNTSGIPYCLAALASIASASGQVRLHIPIGAMPNGRFHVDQHPGQHAQGFDLLDVKRASPLFTGTAVDEIEDYPGQAAASVFTSIRGAEYLIAHRDQSLKQTGG